MALGIFTTRGPTPWQLASASTPRSAKPGDAPAGDGQRTSAAGQHILLLEQMAQDRARDTAAKMKSPFGPVQAQAKLAMATWSGPRNDPHGREPLHARIGERDLVVTDRNKTPPDQCPEQRDTEMARQMADAGSRGRQPAG